MKPLKSSYFRKWNHWIIHEPKTYTPAGNIRSPGYAKVIEWISECWDELDSSLIERSFDHCGITSNQLADFGSQLRYFVRTKELVDTVEFGDEADGGMIWAEADGDEWSDQVEATEAIDAESDDDENNHEG